MTTNGSPHAELVLEDGTRFGGFSFGSDASASGEVVFNTGMVGYTESFTDPSYRGQILTLTYPLIGNYGVPDRAGAAHFGGGFESGMIQISGLVVSEICMEQSHWNAGSSLSEWLKESKIPAIAGIDTRSLTKILREKGTMLGKIIVGERDVAQFDPAGTNMVKDVSCSGVLKYGEGGKTVVVIDCGCKNNIIDSLVKRGVNVVRVPWDHDFSSIDYDGVFISNGPGDPVKCVRTISNLKKALDGKCPVFGICLGNQLLALAAGAKTYKLKYGHRSQNQPCIESGTGRCYITSQNHGYAIDGATIPAGWEPWFINANDGTVEGIRHNSGKFMSVQFHPEAKPGPTDTAFLFDKFVGML